MNKNTIVLSILKACLFWYVVLLVIFPVKMDHDWFLVVMHEIWIGVQSLVIGGLTGAVIALVLYFTKSGNIAHSLMGENDGSIAFSIGKIPAFRSWDRDEKAACPTEFLGFMKEYEKAFPVHARLFKAGIQILAAYRYIPASVVPGGHGGASLETHSFNVLREAIQAMTAWVYKGQFTSSGYQTAAIQDKAFRFYPDPLIPLCALLHDLGKIECYQIIDDTPTEVKKRHDEEGSKMLSALPEFRALSVADRSAMSIAVGYYHHPGSIPLNQQDRPRALAVFTLEMDVKAGKKEGGYIQVDDEETVSAPAPGTVMGVDTGGQQDEIAASSAVTGILSEVLPEDQREKFTANRHYPTDVCTDALAVFIREYVRKPNYFGLKKNGVCFCQDVKMREHLNSINKTKSFNDPHAHHDGKSARLTSFTMKVLWALHDRGMLVSTFQNAGGAEYKFSPNTAVFDISGTSLDGSVRATKFCLVFVSDVSPLIDEIEDCPNPFTVVRNSLGDQYRQDKGSLNRVSLDRELVRPVKGSKEGIDLDEFDPSVILNSVASITKPENSIPDGLPEKPSELTGNEQVQGDTLKNAGIAQSGHIDSSPINPTQQQKEQNNESDKCKPTPGSVQQKPVQKDW